jgi:hypothetical protein
VKISAERTLVAPTPHGVTLSVADFDQSKWEFMYPHFVEEGLDPSDCANKKDV